MAFGSTSSVFRRFAETALDRTYAFDLDTDTFKCALYNDTGTPDKDAADGAFRYNTGAWAVANELTDTSGSAPWPATGRPLVTPDVTVPASGVVQFDAADTASVDATTDITGARGCLIYDDTIASPAADPGVCFLAFGSAQSVTNGTFTVVYHANGIFRVTV